MNISPVFAPSSYSYPCILLRLKSFLDPNQPTNINKIIKYNLFSNKATFYFYTFLTASLKLYIWRQTQHIFEWDGGPPRLVPVTLSSLSLTLCLHCVCAGLSSLSQSQRIYEVRMMRSDQLHQISQFPYLLLLIFFILTYIVSL